MQFSQGSCHLFSLWYKHSSQHFFPSKPNLYCSFNGKQIVNLSLCLINQALCHEDTCRSGGMAPPFFILALDGGE
jgi:hypothetical protein